MSPETSQHKADFDSIYDRRDPRGYYATLAPLDYQIPQHGCDVTARLLDELRETRPDLSVLDVCCSYGVLAMLLKTDLDLSKLCEHYADEEALDADGVVASDRKVLDEHRHPRAPRVLGLDVAGHAIDYAIGTGALDDGAAENLETDEPTDRLIEMLSDVDLVTTTGGVGYVTEKTFDRLVDLTPDSTWFATFCLRTYDFSPIAETMTSSGRRTESATRTFRQRRFTDPDEQQWAVAEATSWGFDPIGKEDDGYFHAELHLSRPVADADRVPFADLLPDLLVPGC